MRFFKTPNIDFIKRRRIAYFVSVFLFIIGISSLVVRGGLNLGIDFEGGSSVLLRYKKNENITLEAMRQTLADVGLSSAEIKQSSRVITVETPQDSVSNQESGGEDAFIQIYTEDIKGTGTDETVRQLELALSQLFQDTEYEILRTETVGRKIGKELGQAAILAIIISLFLILLYIGWRFEFIFAGGAIAALFHDVIITLGIFNLLNFEISLKEIAAFLTIVGYSLNDTIVVYDRIRENLKVMRSEDLPTIMNRSINQCLSRTVITSLTTFAVVLILFLFGGEVIRGFAFAMLVGVIVGTYSSIFVASPVVLEWQMKHGGKRQLRMFKKRKR
jgi:preprotein translocase subunit SecF